MSLYEVFFWVIKQEFTMSSFFRACCLCTLVGLVGMISSCDDMEDAGFSVSVTITLPQAIPIVMPSSEALASINMEDDGSRIVPMCDGSQTVCMPTVHLANVDLLALDRTGALDGYGDRINSIEIEQINSIITENTLPVDVQPIQVRIGNQEQTFEESLVAGNTLLYAQGTTGTQAATMNEANQAAIGESIGTLQFASGLGTSLLIPDGSVGETGRTDVEIQLVLSVKISPLAGL